MTTRSTDTLIRHILAEGCFFFRREGNGGFRPCDATPSASLVQPFKGWCRSGFYFNFFEDKQSVRLTLMHIRHRRPRSGLKKPTMKVLKLWNRAQRHRTERAQGGRGCHAQACGFRFRQAKIENKVTPPQMGKAHDIIREAVEGRYDAVVLGRRVQAGLADVMDQSVCAIYSKAWRNPLVSLCGCVVCRKLDARASCCVWTAPILLIALPIMSDTCFPGYRGMT